MQSAHRFIVGGKISLFRKERSPLLNVYTEVEQRKRDEKAVKGASGQIEYRKEHMIGMTRKRVKEGRCRDPRGI
jgi:hypothetical protein